MGAMGIVYHFSTMAGIPLVTWISTKVGKKNALVKLPKLGRVIG